MKKRKVGERGKVLFDTTDFLIANILARKQPIGVLDLAKEVGNMKHTNLKNHLDKLEKSQLIKREQVPKSSKILVSLNDKVYTKEVMKSLLKILDKVNKS
jgi:DNA-binding MarR family transcriptional regulator